MIKTIHNSVILFLILLICSVNGSVPDNAMDLFNIEWTGSSALRASTYSEALDIVRSNTSVVDTTLRYFKLGFIYYKLGNNATALPYFKLAAQQSAALAPIAYSILGDMAYKDKDFKNATAAYIGALSPNAPDGYTNYIYSKLKSIPEIDTIAFQSNFAFQKFKQWLKAIEEKNLPP